MAFRLVYQEGGETRRRRLRRGENLVGSAPSCDIVIDHPSVSRHHTALVVISEERLEVADLGSRNGTWLEEERLAGKRTATAGNTIAFGSISGHLERMEAADATPADLPGVSPRPTAAIDTRERELPSNTTASVGPLSVFALGYLPGLMAALAAGAPLYVLAQRCGAALLETLPLGRLQISTTPSADARRELFAGESVRTGGTLGRVEVEGVVLDVELPNAETLSLFRPVLETVAALLGAARQRDPIPDRIPEGGFDRTKAESSPRMPDPPSIEPVVRHLYERARKVAVGDVNVLILGESGTGKEILARFLHRASLRSSGPFVALNCAALPRDLQESELFGIERGVATGVDARPGLFEQAHEGTLFLDEIGEMASEVQAKILRVLQEEEVFRLGGTQPRRADVRVLSATHRDVGEMVADGTFRVDLFHRIADWQARIPPLRERVADIPNLAAFFLERAAAAQGREPVAMSEAALDAVRKYHWPGNIRQLEREISRGLLFAEPGELFDSDCLSPEVRAARDRDCPMALATVLAEAERRAIREALERADGDIAAAARSLAVAVSTLYRKVKALDIQADLDADH